MEQRVLTLVPSACIIPRLTNYCWLSCSFVSTNVDDVDDVHGDDVDDDHGDEQGISHISTLTPLWLPLSRKSLLSFTVGIT